MKRLFAMLLAALLLASTMSCGKTVETESQSETKAETTVSEGGETEPEPVETKEPYLYPELNLNGGDFHILNQTASSWNYYSTYDVAETNGEPLNDKIYERNRFIEETFNTKFVITDKELDAAASHLKVTIKAAEDLYQYAYIFGSYLSSVIGAGYTIDLETVKGLQLDKPWWDPDRAEYSIGRTYFVKDSASLLGFHGAFCSFFNKNLFTDLGLENPYELVKNGQWTLDKLQEFIESGASLNGDEKYTGDSPNCRFGLVGWENGYQGLWAGSDITLVTVEEGKLTYAVESEKAINAFEKVARVVSTPGYSEGNYPALFAEGRSVMTLGQVKEAIMYRDMEDDFGILPLPKYDENQEEYRSYIVGCPFLIPATTIEYETAALVADAMSYYSYAEVVPVLLDNIITHKSLRDPDSVEMLEIIRDGETIDLGTLYGWTASVEGGLKDKIKAGGTELASTAAKYKTQVEKAMNKFLEKIEG